MLLWLFILGILGHPQNFAVKNLTSTYQLNYSSYFADK